MIPTRFLAQRISFRIAMAMMPAMLLVLALFSVASVWREADLVAEEMRRDTLDVGTIVAGMLADQPGDVAREQLEKINDDIDPLHISLEESEPVGLSDAVVGTSVPVLLFGGQRRWLVVTEPLVERDAFVQRSLLVDLVGGLVAGLAAFGLAAAVGRSIVQRRVESLIRRLRAVGKGEYPDISLDMGADELGKLADAMVKMTDQLRGARESAKRSAEDQRRLQLQLRRADRLAAVGRTVAVFAHEVGTPRADRLCRALWTAAWAIVQRRLSRAMGFLTVSVQTTALLGMLDPDPVGHLGGLVMWGVTGVSLLGLGLVTAALLSRRGELWVDDYSGLAGQAPVLASLFLLFGLASVGAPGTAAFASTDLVLHGSMASHPATLMVFVSAISVQGYAVLHLFYRVFFGPEVARSFPDALPRERRALMGLAGLVILVGLAPQILVDGWLMAGHVILTGSGGH